MVSIGDFVLPEAETTVRLDRCLREGRLLNRVIIHTALLGDADDVSFEERVNSLSERIEAFDRGEATLTMTEGRYYWGKRENLERTIDYPSRFAAFEIRLLTEDRYERSLALHLAEKTLTQSGEVLSISQAGNSPSIPEITLFAMGSLENPSVSDGTKTLSYAGALESGERLVIDGEGRTVRLNGETNVLHLVTGDFPRLAPGETGLTYTDRETSSHSALLSVRYRDVWA